MSYEICTVNSCAPGLKTHRCDRVVALFQIVYLSS